MPTSISTLVVGLNNINPTGAITATCSRTIYPDLCLNSLVDNPGSLNASEQDLIHITVNMTLHEFGWSVLYFNPLGPGINHLNMDPYMWVAYDDCSKIFEEVIGYLSKSMESLYGSGDDLAKLDPDTHKNT
ncbi:probable pectinesterase/pectinesterase inhibitor 61 [Impatiens glandulifera]|uniref:probable pectinesterase/pectinesterase inhibitor 61 n=1 Tax=Impatiens glandulifera TaxID=253017 RepID=UPI001FB15031|nr:probable pectinesterase/pectinesterase inhibitor 61 [Impatiens glandulifera]